MLSAKNIKPCFFIIPKCSVHGGMKYERSPEEVEQVEGEEHATWETKRVINNKDEYRNAQNLRGRFLREANSLGVSDDVGVIVEMEREDDIADLHAEWKQTFTEFNSGAKHSKIRFRISKFRITSDNEQILQDMLLDMRETMDELREMIVAADYKGIRQVVSRMKGWVTVLPDQVAAGVQATIEDARKQANEIRRALKKRGEALEDVQEEVSTATVDLTRFAMMGDSDESEDTGPDSAEVFAAAAGAQAAAAFFGSESSEDEEDPAIPPRNLG